MCDIGRSCGLPGIVSRCSLFAFKTFTVRQAIHWDQGTAFMFFKRSNKAKQDGPLPIAEAQKAGSTSPIAPVPAAALRKTADPSRLGFETTAELEPAFSLVGQERALKAIEFGMSIEARDFNIFVTGPPASGKRTAVRNFLKTKAAQTATPSDWIYVNNFDDSNAPRALQLPTGRAQALAKAMAATIEELRATLPAAFESEEYQARKRAIDEEFRASHEGALEALNARASAQNIAILRTPMGFTLAPMHDGKVVKAEVYNQLPEAMRQQVEARIEALQKELADILSAAPKAEKQHRARLSELSQAVSRTAVHAAIDDVRREFANVPEAVSFIGAAEADLVRNAGVFLDPTGQTQPIKEPIETSRDPRFRRYLVNVLVGGGEARTGAPIVEEANPTLGNLTGRIEHVAQMGTLVTDFLLIRPGALQKANGGYLLLDARKVLASPFAWEALKRTIKTGEIKIESPADDHSLISTQTLEPQAIPLKAKLILFGEPELYYLLSQQDPDFPRLFKVQADFDDKIGRSAENELDYARLIAAIVAEHGIKPFSASGVARIIDEGARLAGDSEKLSIEIGRIADIVREADYWSGAAGRSTTTHEDVARSIEARVQRSDRMRDHTLESFERGVVLVDTEGAKTGQINALSVHQLGDFAFGRPSRITARVRLGQGRVTDIEREVKLGGPLHSKGVMILWGYLAGRYAQEMPLALAATLVFEQSYGEVDGDSASSAELFALLSALSDAPIEQGFAVTGSVNQLGEVQAVGAANEKIEGFFDICKARGLNGRQGVLIPKSTAQHLMVREDVIQAVTDRKFAIYAISTIDEGIEILTGLRAGEREANGFYPEGSINRRIEDKLKSFAERARSFAASATGEIRSAKRPT